MNGAEDDTCDPDTLTAGERVYILAEEADEETVQVICLKKR